MKKACIFVLLAALAMSGVSCAAADKIGIRGCVTGLDAGGGSVVILVEGSVEADTSYDIASVTVTPKTAVSVRKDGKESAAAIGDIKLGSMVEVVFDGAVAESYPVQGRAKKVIIIG